MKKPRILGACSLKKSQRKLFDPHWAAMQYSSPADAPSILKKLCPAVSTPGLMHLQTWLKNPEKLRCIAGKISSKVGNKPLSWTTGWYSQFSWICLRTPKRTTNRSTSCSGFPIWEVKHHLRKIQGLRRSCI